MGSNHSWQGGLKKSNFSTPSFADNSNGCNKSFQFQVLHNEIPKCMVAMIRWSNLHLIKINPDKTEIILLRPPSLDNQILTNGVFIGDHCIRFSNELKKLESGGTKIWISINKYIVCYDKDTRSAEVLGKSRNFRKKIICISWFMQSLPVDWITAIASCAGPAEKISTNCRIYRTVQQKWFWERERETQLLKPYEITIGSI